MLKKRRVALAIDLSVGMRHHHDVFAGILRYGQERADWHCSPQPFIHKLQRAEGGAGYHGIIARATAPLVREAAAAGVPLVNVWAGSPAQRVPSVLPDVTACGRIAAEHLATGPERRADQGTGTRLRL